MFTRAVRRLPGLALLFPLLCGLAGADPAPELRTYEVGKAVSAFPPRDDCATPEAAYATVMRHLAAGKRDWRALSVKRLADDLPEDDPAPVPVAPEEADAALATLVVEVRCRGELAVVLARLPGGGIDLRQFAREDGQWRNAGEEVVRDLEAARRLADGSLGVRVRRLRGPKIADPNAWLARFVDDLKQHGRDPKAAILSAVADHRLTVIGELHHRPTYWALNTAVVQDPAFARTASTIYLELPGNGQDRVERFLEADRYDPAPVIEMLRDNLELGWPDEPMLRFFEAVWKVNQALPQEERLRVVLVDMERPWHQIRQREDWRRYDVDRDRLMADNILQDLERRDDERHALFIVGFGHAERLAPGGVDRAAGGTAGMRLRGKLGAQVYSFVQHGPVIENVGPVLGRVCFGLFDAAFAASGNQPVAFPLAGSPFGTQPFDADGDLGEDSTVTYAEAFDAYLYLGPLEDEVFSPLIPGFYTDEFAREVDRRYVLMYGKGLVAGAGLPAVSGGALTEYLRRTWGRPRDWVQQLGPIDAWKEGGR